LVNDKTDTKKRILCFYPSRSNWILKKFPSLVTKITLPKCEALKKEIETLDVKQVTLILASAHINSPASAFGHTFLRLDTNEETVLASHSVNYAAITDESNGILFAYHGLFGGYKGQYSVEPYSKRLETYSDIEQRDIWEYPLDFTPAEIEKMLLHILEIRNFYADYFFVSENCSYNLLWLFEVAKDDVNLNNQFGFKAIPIDTVRAVENAGLVKGAIYRPSKRVTILSKAKPIAHIPEATEFAKSSDYDLNKISQLPPEQQAKTLELATHLLQLKYNKGKITREIYLKHFIKILTARSKLGSTEEAKINIPEPPTSAHQSSKLSFSIDSEGRTGIDFKIAYHDIYDNEVGFVPGAFINFLDTSLKLDDGNLRLEEIDLLNIRSYAIRDALFKPISWEVALGAKRNFDDSLDSFLRAGAGITVGRDKLYSFATITPTIYFDNDNGHSVSANLGVIYNPSPFLKMGLLGSNEWFEEDKNILTLEPFITVTTSKNTALNFKYNYDNSSEENAKGDAELSLFWYF